MEKQDIEIMKVLMHKAKERELGASSIIYYYALKHAIEELEGEENGEENRAEAADSKSQRGNAE